jgi:hypothetical protein
MPARDKRYPKNWPSISKRAIERALNRCEGCAVENHTLVRRRRPGGQASALQVVSEESFVMAGRVSGERSLEQRKHKSHRYD